MRPLFQFAKTNLPTEAECAEFRDLCQRLSLVLHANGISKAPFRSPEVSRFRKYPDGSRILSFFRAYVEILESAQNQGDDLKDSKRLLWRMVQRMGYIPQSDIFDLIEDEDLVEIYTVDNLQVFRNLKFFEYVSATIEEIVTFIWNRDSRREGRVTLKLLDVVLRVKLGILNKTRALTDIPRHTMYELVGDRWVISIQMKYVSPLRHEGRLVAGVTTNRSEVLKGSKI